MFPDRLRFERLQHARFERSGMIDDEHVPVDGDRLRQLLSKGAKTPEAAKKLLNQVAAAIQCQPQATASALLQKRKGRTPSSSGPNAGIRDVVNIIREHGAPVSGDGLNILTSGWAISGALAKSAVALGTLSSSGSLHASGTPGHMSKGRALRKAAIALGALGSSSLRLRRLRNHSADGEGNAEVHDDRRKVGVAAKVAHFGTRLMRRVGVVGKKRRYQRKVGVSPESVEEENHSHFWQFLPPGEVLHCLRLGAKSLDGEDFKQLLQAAWSLFDECDVVTWMIEPKARSDSHASQLLSVQKMLAEAVTHSGHHDLDAESMHQQLMLSDAMIQQLKELCDEADDLLLRRAALYGLPILLERVSVWIHASQDQITDQTICKASRAAVHEMDALVAKVLDSFTPYEIAVEDGLGYQAPHHSCDKFLTSQGSPSSGAAVVCEEAWSRFLRSREKVQRSQLDDKTEESREHALASSGRFCTHKLLRAGFTSQIGR